MSDELKDIDLGKKPFIVERTQRKYRKNFKKNKKIPFMVFGLLVIVFLIGTYFIIKKPSLNQVAKSVVKINVYDAEDKLIQNGSGFSVFKSNYIVTNYHVIEGAYKIEIVTYDNKIHKIDDILIFNKREDIAILTGNFKLKPLKLVEENSEEGDEVVAIGSPTGKNNEQTHGIVYNADVPYRIVNSAKISPGSSGGVLLNEKHQVIGITTGQYISEKRDDLYFAVGSMYIERALQSLKDTTYQPINNFNINKCRNTILELIKVKEIGFLKCENSQNEFYSPSNNMIFYELTNKYLIFDKSFNSSYYLSFNNLKNVYNNMSNDRKENVVDRLIYILDYEYDFHYDGMFTFFNENKDISDWNSLEFFMNLEILSPIDYSIIEEDLELYNSQYEKYNRVISDYGLSEPTEMLVLVILGENNIHDFSNSDIRSLYEFMQKKISYNIDLQKVLLSLGYYASFNGNGKLIVGW